MVAGAALVSRSQWQRLGLSAFMGGGVLVAGFSFVNLAAKYPVLVTLIYIPVIAVCTYGWHMLTTEGKSFARIKMPS